MSNPVDHAAREPTHDHGMDGQVDGKPNELATGSVRCVALSDNCGVAFCVDLWMNQAMELLDRYLLAFFTQKQLVRNFGLRSGG